MPTIKVGKCRDTVSVEPGSRPFLGSVSVSETHFFGVAGKKDTFSYTNDTLRVSKRLETVSVSESSTQILCIGNNLAKQLSFVYFATHNLGCLSTELIGSL